MSSSEAKEAVPIVVVAAEAAAAAAATAEAPPPAAPAAEAAAPAAEPAAEVAQPAPKAQASYRKRKRKQWRPFESARDFARSLGLKSQKAWKTYRKGGSRPEDIPGSPDEAYKDKGWISWGDFLGTGNNQNNKKAYRSFEACREFARTLNLRKFATAEERCETERDSQRHRSHAPVAAALRTRMAGTWKEWMQWS